MSALTLIPEAEKPSFAALPDAVRSEFFALIDVLGAELRERKVSVATCRAAAQSLGLGWQTIYGRCRRFRDTGDWRCLINRSKAGKGWWVTKEYSLPRDFVEHWKGLCERNQRKCAPAYRKLIRQWRDWRTGNQEAAIPGYSRPPEPDPRTGVPRGWSQRNLTVEHGPSKWHKTAARIGRFAADTYRPTVMRTRVGLEVGHYYQFDDMWHDFKVNVVGQSGARRLLQFHCLDVFSACLFARGMRPVMEDASGREERLKESEMRFLVAHVLSEYGYHPEGTVLHVEHGTAAIREDMERMLHDLTGGKVRVGRSAIGGSPAFAGLYDGPSKGNYRLKAHLESLHNLIHNDTADTLLLPGQTGANSRTNKPEELHGRERANKALIRAMAALPDDRRGLLRFPFVELNQALRLVTDILDTIDARTEHELEGWVEAGLVTNEFRWPGEERWHPVERLLEVPSEQRHAVESIITPRCRKLSPREVFDLGRRALEPLKAEARALLYGPDLRRPVRVSRKTIEFEDKDLSPSPLLYEANRFQDGEKFDAVANPYNLDELMLFDGAGRYMGTARRWERAQYGDADQLKEQYKRVAKAEKELVDELARRGAQVTRQRIEDSRHNAAVLSGAPMTEEEKAAARASQRAAARAAAVAESALDSFERPTL